MSPTVQSANCQSLHFFRSWDSQSSFSGFAKFVFGRVFTFNPIPGIRYKKTVCIRHPSANKIRSQVYDVCIEQVSLLLEVLGGYL